MQMGPAFLLWVVLEQINIPINPFLLRMGKHVLPRLGNVGQHVSAAFDHGTREENTGKGPFRLSLLHTDHRGRAMTCLTVSVVGLAGPIANSPKGGFKKDLELRCWVGSEDVRWMGLCSPSVPCGWATTRGGVNSCRRMAHDNE